VRVSHGSVFGAHPSVIPRAGNDRLNCCDEV
jgi:hypothetical protein